MKNRKVIPKKNSTYRLKSGIWGGHLFNFLSQIHSMIKFAQELFLL